MRKWYIRAIVVEVIVLAFLLVLCAFLGKMDTNHSGHDTTSTMQSSSLINDGLVDDPFGSAGTETGTSNSTSTPATGSGTSAPATVPGTSTPSATSKPTQPTTPPATSKPTNPTNPAESQPVATTPSTEATKPSEGVEVMTYEKYINMTATEQKAYRNTFDSVTAFFEWYNHAKAEYDAQKPNVDVGDGPIDLGGGNG